MSGRAEISSPQLVRTPKALQALVARLEHVERAAVDTESNSLHAYRERVCLIQISIPGEDFVVDPLALDVQPLAAFFASSEIEKVFHAADYDLMGLRRDFGFTCGALFDTMWAARILGWRHVGLGAVLQEHFGVTLHKRFQRYDWGHRPLEAEALHYAWMDTHYLLPLREMQAAALVKAGRWEEAQEIFHYLREHVPAPRTVTPEALFWRIKGVRDLSPQEQAVLYRLHLWREAEAARLDRPAAMVVDDGRLVRLARVQPRRRSQLTRAGLTTYQARRFGKAILQAMRGKPIPVPPPPSGGERPSPQVMERYEALKAWRREVAEHRGVDPDVILPNSALWAIAQKPPRTPDDLLHVPGIGPWRRDHYGPAILRLLGKWA